MEHAEARELLEIAAVEPDGFDRLVGRRHVRGGGARRPPRRLPGVRRRARAAAPRRRPSSATSSGRSPPPDLRERTLAFVAAVGRDRSAGAAPAASAMVAAVRRHGPERRPSAGSVPRPPPSPSTSTRRAAAGRPASAGSPALGGLDRGRDRPRARRDPAPRGRATRRADRRPGARTSRRSRRSRPGRSRIEGQPDAEQVALDLDDRRRDVDRHARLLAEHRRSSSSSPRDSSNRRPGWSTVAGWRVGASGRRSARCSLPATSPTGSVRSPTSAASPEPTTFGVSPSPAGNPTRRLGRSRPRRASRDEPGGADPAGR